MRETREYSVDLHVHIGSSLQGEPIKITASPRLTLTSIIKGGMQRKGLTMVGIVDAASPPVIDDLEYLLTKGELEEMEEGGFVTPFGEVLIGGSEVEVKEEDGMAHFLSFLPSLKRLKAFSQKLSKSIKNIHLSSQRTSFSVEDLYQLTQEEGGLFLPAHAFTPFKSIYGSCCSSLKDLLPSFSKKIGGVELGLSADTFIASHLTELWGIPFLSNSDAHSLEKMGREFNRLKMQRPTFKELVKAINEEEGRGIVANYGLDPRLGKYHRTYCHQCSSSFQEHAPPLLQCPENRNHQVVKGVLDRVKELGMYENLQLCERPPYIYQIPLHFIPGLGEKGRERLFQALGSEEEILHHIEEEEIERVVGPMVAKRIIMARKGELVLESGGGGIYGRVLEET